MFYKFLLSENNENRTVTPEGSETENSDGSENDYGYDNDDDGDDHDDDKEKADSTQLGPLDSRKLKHVQRNNFTSKQSKECLWAFGYNARAINLNTKRLLNYNWLQRRTLKSFRLICFTYLLALSTHLSQLCYNKIY